jgi:ABC-type lipoprotein export system ATPase subunit
MRTLEIAEGLGIHGDPAEADAAPVRARSNPAILLSGVRQTFNGMSGVAIDELAICRGAVTAILGRSGSGKSTLLNLIGGMIEAEDTGAGARLDALLHDKNGQPVTQKILCRGWTGRSGAIGFVFQHPFLLQHAPGRTNLAMSLAAAGRSADFALIDRFWTDQLRIPIDKASIRARELSGGMQQRLAVGRALIREPQIILADEPTANLDPQIGDEIIERLVRWQRRGGDKRTIILVTHDVQKAARYADHIIILDPAVVSQSNAQIEPGRLLGDGASWPRSNPGARVISAWMQGDAHAKPAPDEVPARDTAGNLVHASFETSPAPVETEAPVLPDRASPAAIWARLGTAALFSERAAPARGRSMLQAMKAHFFEALCFVPMVITAYLAGFGDETSKLIGMALLPITLPVAVMPLVKTLARIVILRAVVLTILATIAIASVKAQNVIDTVMEARLGRPDLQPLIALRGSKPLRWSEVDGLQQEFEDARFVPRSESGAAGRAVYGRVSLGGVRILLPENASGESAPACPAGGANVPLKEAPVLGIDPAEPFMANLEWSPVTPGMTQARGEKNWLAGGRQPPPALETKANAGVYILDSYLRSDLQVRDGDKMPLWVCMSDSGGFTYAPYPIIALIRYLPVLEKRQHAVVASCEVAARFRSESMDCQDSDFIYDHVAIRLASDRIGHLRMIKRLSDRGKIQAETGFQKVQEAITTASVSAGIASWFILLTAVLAGSVTFFFVMQFIEENRRPLAVARAFGAGFPAASILLGISLALPILVALLMGLFFSLFAVPVALQVAYLIFNFDVVLDAGGVTAFLIVAAGGSVLVMSVFLFTLGVWWLRGAKSMASELQEVG